MLEFESTLKPLEHELEAARRKEHSNGSSPEEVRIEAAIADRLTDIYSKLTPWEKVQVARHRERPYTLDYLQWGFSDFVELRGDRTFGEDRAIVGGPALLGGRPVMIVGHQKGRDTKENLQRNFGMPHPEGYRKAERFMRQAERMSLPVITFVDTPGAHAGLQDEERGQSEAIASSISTMLDLRVPTLCVVIGEGGSGGALAIAVADRILMLEHSIFTVASPEAAAAILWLDSARAPEAAASMKITPEDLKALGLVDRILPEPVGGAHRDPAGVATTVREAIVKELAALESTAVDELLERRYHKYRDLRFYAE